MKTSAATTPPHLRRRQQLRFIKADFHPVPLPLAGERVFLRKRLIRRRLGGGFFQLPPSFFKNPPPFCQLPRPFLEKGVGPLAAARGLLSKVRGLFKAARRQ